MAKIDSNDEREELKSEIRNLDSMVGQLLKDTSNQIAGATQSTSTVNLYDEYSNLVRSGSYNFYKSKSNNVSYYNYLANSLMGKRANPKKDTKQDNIEARLNMERIFQNGDTQLASLFFTQASDIHHICDEVESVCAYMYQLDEAINVIRDNVMNVEQTTNGLPFDIKFNSGDGHDEEYAKIVEECYKSSGMHRKMNQHVVPKSLKFGRYYVMTVPYSEIGVKMMANKNNGTHNLFNYMGSPMNSMGPVHESMDIPENYKMCMENVDALLNGVYGSDENRSQQSITFETKFGKKDNLKDIIKYNIDNLLVDDEDTPPNVTGIQESVFGEMSDDLKTIVNSALKRAGGMAPKSTKSVKNEDKNIADAVIDPSTVDSIPGCFVKLVDPRMMVPIKIFDHIIGYYYFENYDYARMGTTVTDMLTNQINFNEQNMVIDNMVRAILGGLKYGDILNGDDNFKSMILNCILYAEKRQNPIKIKFVPVEFVTEFATNKDENNNGQPVLLKSLVFGRLYVSLLLFNITAILTKSTDTEFYYLHDGLLSQSYEDQVNDIIDQFRNGNIDISQVLNGDILHGNRSINKRYFMCTGPQDIQPFNMEVISGQSIDIHNDLLTDLKKMTIGSTGVPSVAIDYMDEVEFATILKMTNTKVMTRCNDIQVDYNDPITELCKKITKFNRPNAIPEEAYETMECTLRTNNTINNNIIGDELNNNIATADNMVETYYGNNAESSSPVVPYEKDEMRKRLIMKMSSSLPWGFMEENLEDVKIEAKRKMEEEKIKTSEGEE